MKLCIYIFKKISVISLVPFETISMNIDTSLSNRKQQLGKFIWENGKLKNKYNSNKGWEKDRKRGRKRDRVRVNPSVEWGRKEAWNEGEVERRGWEKRKRKEGERDKRDCSIKRNVNPAHTHCEYPRYLQWVGRPFASAAGVEPFHWAAPSLPLFVHASPSLSLSSFASFSLPLSGTFPSTTAITAFFEADDFLPIFNRSGFEEKEKKNSIRDVFAGDGKLYNWGRIYEFF